MGDLFDSAVPVTGNTAKVHCLLALEQHLQAHQHVTILDVGCVGPDPLEFWRPLMDRYASRFTLYGIDVHGIERGVAAARQNGWTNVRLTQGSGYALSRLFEPERFDVLVATQVLEHMRHWRRFLGEIRCVLRSGGMAILTFDSGEYRRIEGLVERSTRLIKWALAVGLGNERYWDVPVRGEEVVRGAREAGFEVVDHRYYNLNPVKYLHNHVVPASDKNGVLRNWYQLESTLNRDGPLVAARPYFMGQYCTLRRVG